MIEAVQSVLNQTFRTLELIIIEDPSESEHRDLILQLNHPAVRYVRNAERTSLPRQHNQGLQLARGQFIGRFDSDDIAAPRKLERQIAFLRQNPEVDLVGSDLLIINERGHVLGERHYPSDHQSIRMRFPRSNPVANSTVLFRRSVYDRFGGWRESSPDPAQDYEWFSRVAIGGGRFSNLSEPLVKYRIHSGAIKRRHLRGTLRTTIEVKEMYWKNEMTTVGHLLLLAERLMLFLPSSLIYRLFTALRYRRPSGRRESDW